MWKTEGFAGFMKGNGINVIRVSASAVTAQSCSWTHAYSSDLAILRSAVLRKSPSSIGVTRQMNVKLTRPQSYGVFKSMLRKWTGEEELSNLWRLSAGAGAGIVAVGTCPRRPQGRTRIIKLMLPSLHIPPRPRARASVRRDSQHGSVWREIRVHPRRREARYCRHDQEGVPHRRRVTRAVPRMLGDCSGRRTVW
jgi:hypothetical protein